MQKSKPGSQQRGERHTKLFWITQKMKAFMYVCMYVYTCVCDDAYVFMFVLYS